MSYTHPFYPSLFVRLVCRIAGHSYRGIATHCRRCAVPVLSGDAKQQRELERVSNAINRAMEIRKTCSCGPPDYEDQPHNADCPVAVRNQITSYTVEEDAANGCEWHELGYADGRKILIYTDRPVIYVDAGTRH